MYEHEDTKRKHVLYVLPLKVPFAYVYAFSDRVDQDQIAHNVQFDLESTLSAIPNYHSQYNIEVAIFQ